MTEPSAPSESSQESSPQASPPKAEDPAKQAQPAPASQAQQVAVWDTSTTTPMTFTSSTFRKEGFSALKTFQHTPKSHPQFRFCLWLSFANLWRLFTFDICLQRNFLYKCQLFAIIICLQVSMVYICLQNDWEQFNLIFVFLDNIPTYNCIYWENWKLKRKYHSVPFSKQNQIGFHLNFKIVFFCELISSTKLKTMKFEQTCKKILVSPPIKTTQNYWAIISILKKQQRAKRFFQKIQTLMP